MICIFCIIHILDVTYKLLEIIKQFLFFNIDNIYYFMKYFKFKFNDKSLDTKKDLSKQDNVSAFTLLSRYILYYY